MSVFRWLRKIWSMSFGWGDGISWPGPWRVIYPDGARTRPLQYGQAVAMQEIHGGTLIYCEDFYK